MNDFILKLTEVFEVSSVKMTDEITSFENWDSLTSLSLIALIDEEFGISITANELIEAKTIDGLIKLIQTKK
jgi:acyl carrier protein